VPPKQDDPYQNKIEDLEDEIQMMKITKNSL
jgi:hypothetical protein